MQHSRARRAFSTQKIGRSDVSRAGNLCFTRGVGWFFGGWVGLTAGEGRGAFLEKRADAFLVVFGAEQLAQRC